MCMIYIVGKPVTAPLDSGRVVILVRHVLVNPAGFHPSSIGVICIHGIHGDTHDY